MSKNVAVFVDVANIFYAAKAAGVDIDYVTLLKTAIAGRDFVRAYAYTGLDPENENQRQFHSFLARNGYKVISKDIRKYGDGRIKANLDIELVVDMMRMAHNLDIAVVVSGDGDFAPAIRAVQENGVRVEVISFRGNTSSDLIEVADTFTDIAQIARVDKGSRSGRRVASEGDLSMTAVPEKETEGLPRRRRGSGRGREDRPAAAADATPATHAAQAGNLIVLPGERLSRAGEEEDLVSVAAMGDGAGDDIDGVEQPAMEGDENLMTEEAQRRRRRRGGRGRGRGRRSEAEASEAPITAGAEPTAAMEAGLDATDEDEEEFEELAPAQLPHQTFGSVWDSQLGVPTAASFSPTVESFDDDEELEEPEIPEYLLAERRQRGQQRGGQRGPRMAGRGGRGGGYQAALDRERYGRGGSPAGSASGFGGARPPERQRQDRPRGGRPQQPGRPPRQPDRGPRDSRPAEQPAGARASGDPWSEVPPELEDMLRAELARKMGGQHAEAAGAGSPSSIVETTTDVGSAASLTEAERPKRAPRRRTAKPATDAGSVESEVTSTADPAADATAPKRPTRRRTAKNDAPAEEKPKRASRSRAALTSVETLPVADAPSAEATAAPAKPARRSRAKATPADEG